MDLKQLHYFVTVVEEGSISAAARRLYLSQPPLSAQIHCLEVELGCQLFERGPRKIRLSQAGRMLYDRATAILEMAQLTRRELMAYQQGSSGTLRLGAISSVASTLLSGWLQTFHQVYPRICFEIFEGNTYQLLDQLQDGRLDLALIRTPFSARGFQCTYLLREPMMAVGKPSLLPGESGSSISIAELGTLPLIFYRRWEQVLEEIFEEAHLHPQAFCKNDDARTTAFWAGAGLGVGIVPASVLPLLRNGEMVFRPIEDERLVSSISAVYRGEPATITVSFLEHLGQACQAGDEQRGKKG